MVSKRAIIVKPDSDDPAPLWWLWWRCIEDLGHVCAIHVLGKTRECCTVRMLCCANSQICLCRIARVILMITTTTTTNLVQSSWVHLHVVSMRLCDCCRCTVWFEPIAFFNTQEQPLGERLERLTHGAGPSRRKRQQVSEVDARAIETVGSRKVLYRYCTASIWDYFGADTDVSGRRRASHHFALPRSLELSLSVVPIGYCVGAAHLAPMVSSPPPCCVDNVTQICWKYGERG